MILGPSQTDTVRRAVHQNMVSFWGLFPPNENGPGLKHVDGLTTIDFGIPHPLLRGVLGSELAQDSADEIIESATSRFRKIGGPWSWILEPDCTPNDLAARLGTHGMASAFQMPGMAIDLDRWARPGSPSNLEILFLKDSAELETWLKLCFDVFDIPVEAKTLFRDLHRTLPIAAGEQLGYVLGLLDGKPVATTNYFLGEGVAGIYCVATLEEARGKGIASALVSACLETGQEYGYRVGILQSSSKGFNAYQKLGFEEVCRFNVFVDSTESPSAE